MANITKKQKANSKSKIRSNPSLISSKKAILSVNYSTDPLFATKCHPTEPIIISGSATGRVQSIRYDVEKLINSEQLAEISCNPKDNHSNNSNSVIVNWETKRHKGSCRDLCFDLPSSGNKLYSIGSEGVIKMADVKTGQVISKFIGEKENFNLKMTRCISVPNKEILIVGDEKGTIRCHDARSKGLGLAYEPIKNLHGGESINSISHCCPKSDYKLITVGSTTVCEIDLRKPEKILHESEDQGDEILSSTWLDQETQDVMLCGMGEGVVTVWKPKINEWEDQISRIKICKLEAVESVMSAMDSDSRYIWGGCSNGVVGKVDVKAGKIVEQLIHSNEEAADEVAMLDLDYEYRIVSAGMEGLKIWAGDEDQGTEEENEEDEEFDSNQFNDSDSKKFLSSSEDEIEEAKKLNFESAANLESGSESGSDSGSESGSELGSATDLGSKLDSEAYENSDLGEKADPVDRKKLTRESLKRRFAGLLDHQDTKATTGAAEVEDSDDEIAPLKNPSTKAEETTELKDIRDKLLAQLDDSDDEAVSEEPKIKKQKKKTKKEKKLSAKQLKNAQTHVHGITKFEGL